MPGPRGGKNHHRYNNRRKFTRDPPKRKTEYRHKNQLTEKEVGITEFLSDLDGFSGVIKARISDFHVNEIDMDGNVTKLTDTSYPKDFAVKMVKFNYKEVVESPCKHIPQETWEAIVKLASEKSGEPITLDIGEISKEDRKEVHQCIQSHFGRSIITSTVKSAEDSNKNCMVFKRYNKDVSDKGDNRFAWPEDKGIYVQFLVNKKSIDTVDASFRISSALKIDTKNVTYAGVKDKRGITTQWFCVKKVPPAKILNRTRDRDITVGNFKFKDVPLRLGDLKGNFFRIALRNVTGSNELIEKAMEHIKNKGFINYYGLQRFGNDKEVPTFQIGISLLLGKWKEAIDLILKPKTSDDIYAENGDIAVAKKIYFETSDASQALAKLDRSDNRCVEAKLLYGLKQCADKDYVNALEKVPRAVRLFYMHAFQSLIWNQMVSKRLQLFGMVPVEGDLILVTKAEQGCLAEDIEENEDEELDEELTEQNDKKVESGIRRQEVKTLTSEDLPNYSIYDIVLPLPGYDVTYPENLKQFYKEALQEHGLTLDMPKQSVKTYNLSGNYRQMIMKVENFNWKIMMYNDPTADLIRSDFQELKGRPENESIENGKYKALVMSFNLPPSSYATMILREILKTDTSTSAQAKLNDYHRGKETKKIIIEDNAEDGNENLEEDKSVASSSLLSDAVMFEEFQRSIFNNDDTNIKRKNEEDDNFGKKQKVDDSTDS